ncbi:hypothetical protein OOZ19_15135 [Saccharopolyspora sp. NFXS83]|uniref:hypothetical protein n=1 Tax=Saccharopolyspora sp. NFXS83 TaxID=2993560 RepID=UPI00224A53CD|nr:hypothetical protein [Saccharopolyspora sp. NFXS83]MCX2731575.1 hypothetical protein [Saccharopolyspora sp. NFXS83]
MTRKPPDFSDESVGIAALTARVDRFSPSPELAVGPGARASAAHGRLDRRAPSGKRASAWRDLPEVMEARLSTGMRIGEFRALIDDDVDLAGPVVAVDHRLVRVTGRGLRVRHRNGRARGVLLQVPH